MLTQALNSAMSAQPGLTPDEEQLLAMLEAKRAAAVQPGAMPSIAMMAALANRAASGAVTPAPLGSSAVPAAPIERENFMQAAKHASRRLDAAAKATAPARHTSTRGAAGLGTKRGRPPTTAAAGAHSSDAVVSARSSRTESRATNLAASGLAELLSASFESADVALSGTAAKRARGLSHSALADATGEADDADNVAEPFPKVADEDSDGGFGRKKGGRGGRKGAGRTGRQPGNTPAHPPMPGEDAEGIDEESDAAGAGAAGAGAARRGARKMFFTESSSALLMRWAVHASVLQTKSKSEKLQREHLEPADDTETADKEFALCQAAHAAMASRDRMTLIERTLWLIAQWQRRHGLLPLLASSPSGAATEAADSERIKRKLREFRKYYTVSETAQRTVPSRVRLLLACDASSFCCYPPTLTVLRRSP